MSTPVEPVVLFELDLNRKKGFQNSDPGGKKPELVETISEKNFNNTHLGYHYEDEAIPDFYLNSANLPLYSKYEYRYIPLISNIIFKTQFLAPHVFTSFNVYMYKRFIAIYNHVSISRNSTIIYRYTILLSYVFLLIRYY